MPYALKLLAAVATLGLVAWAGAYLVYRENRLARLEPRVLVAAPVWFGPADAPCTLLIVGDSRIARWAPPPEVSGWRVARAGFPGETATNIAPAARALIADLRPDAVLVHAGANDAAAAAFQVGPAREATVRAAAEATVAVADIARAVGATRTILLTPPPSIGLELWKRAIMGDRFDGRSAEIAAATAELARARGHAVWNGDALFRNAEGRLDSLYRADGVHWSAEAYAALNREVARGLTASCDKTRTSG